MIGFESQPHDERIGEEAIEKEESERYPYSGAIVFGHGFSEKGWKLSWEAKARALGAYQLWKDNVVPRIIFTGGDASDKDKEKYGDDLLSNAEMMRNYIKDRFQVPEDAMLIEDRPGSIKTVDNVGLAINALEKDGLPTDNFVTVSTGFHLDRIQKIMDKYNLESQPVSAEQELSERARQHADKMRQKDIKNGLEEKQVEKNYQYRLGLYNRALERIKLKDPGFIGELKGEPKWQEAMDNWGYWGPLTFAVKGDKLKEIIENNREDISAWLERHPDIGLSIDELYEGLMEGSVNYRELVKKGREVPE